MGGSAFWFIALISAGGGYAYAFNVIWSRSAQREKAAHYSGLQLAGFLLYMVLVSLGLWLTGADGAATYFSALTLGLFLLIPGAVALALYSKGYRDGLTLGESTWRRASVEEVCTCGSSSTRSHAHANACPYWRLVEDADLNLIDVRQRHPEDEDDAFAGSSVRGLREESDLSPSLARRGLAIASNTVGIVLIAGATVVVFALLEPVVEWADSALRGLLG